MIGSLYQHSWFDGVFILLEVVYEHVPIFIVWDCDEAHKIRIPRRQFEIEFVLLKEEK